MFTAPRDGTYVELKCTYGVAPWYCVARWTDENLAITSGGGNVPIKTSSPRWVKPEGGGPSDEGSLQWRPYHDAIDDYVDPTAGYQNDPQYWRTAVARKYALPDNYFEPKQKKSSLWERIFGA